MPVYNAGRFLRTAIDSVLAQTYPRLEIIAVDDGSTDDSWKILQSYRKRFPKIVRVFRLKENQGESAAANLAYQKSRGEFIARMDADDVSRRDRIAKQVAYLQAHPTVAVVGSQARVIDRHGKRIGAKRTPLAHESIYTMFAFVNAMIHPSVMFRKSLMPNRPALYHNTFETTDDYHIYFELLNYGLFANLPEELVSYRIHGTNKSLTNLKEKFWTDTKLRLYAVKRLGYHAPILMFPAIILQAAPVILLPEQWLVKLFLFVRGLKTYRITLGTFTVNLSWTTMKRYALTLR